MLCLLKWLVMDHDFSSTVTTISIMVMVEEMSYHCPMDCAVMHCYWQ